MTLGLALNKLTEWHLFLLGKYNKLSYLQSLNQDPCILVGKTIVWISEMKPYM